ncbi:MAG TPA: hypothetical protein VFU43_25410 [Streptosporangiaceae bacterium]|nr:hypothetical protein [Streptosporangiaceae bacterium]
MRILRKALAVTTAGLLGVGIVAVTTPPAFAAPGDLAPSCISRTLKTFNVVTLTSNCAYGYHIRVIWDLAPDSDCFWLGSGQTVTKANYQSPLVTYGKTVLC